MPETDHFLNQIQKYLAHIMCMLHVLCNSNVHMFIYVSGLTNWSVEETAYLLNTCKEKKTSWQSKILYL